MKTKLKAGLVAAVAALACTLAHADSSSQFYLDLGLGKGHFNGDCTGMSHCDDSSTGYKLFGGYRLTPGVAVELGYFNFGKPQGDVAQPAGGVARVHGHNDGIGGGFAFTTDLASWLNLTGRLGVMGMKSSVTGGNGGAYLGASSESRGKVYAGVDLGFVVSRNVTLHASWDLSNSAFENRRVDLLSLGGSVEF